MAGDSGPRSGRNAPKKTTPKRGKPKMSAEKWAKLTRKEREIDYNGSRFSQVGNTGTAKEAGHKSGKSSRAAGRGKMGSGPGYR